MIAVNRLLKSCATPPASWPSASIFCDCLSCSSSSRRSVTSVTTHDARRLPVFVGHHPAPELKPARTVFGRQQPELEGELSSLVDRLLDGRANELRVIRVHPLVELVLREAPD